MKPCSSLFLVLLTGLVGCGKTHSEPEAAAPATEVPTAVASVFEAAVPPANVVPIPELRTAVAPGDEVLLEAKVMGTMEPFVNNRAIFVVGDEATITSCDTMEGDSCTTPWDACCDDPAVLRAGTATVQIVDNTGAVLRAGVRGVEGLKELSRVRVSGVVAPESVDDALVINATAIQVL